jgi:hypothetical protein
MRKRDGAVGKIVLTVRAEPEAECSDAVGPAQIRSRDTKSAELAYVSDMIDELATIAQRLGCPTLAGILDLARREACLERSRA